MAANQHLITVSTYPRKVHFSQSTWDSLISTVRWSVWQKPCSSYLPPEKVSWPEKVLSFVNNWPAPLPSKTFHSVQLKQLSPCQKRCCLMHESFNKRLQIHSVVLHFLTTKNYLLQTSIFVEVHTDSFYDDFPTKSSLVGKNFPAYPPVTVSQLNENVIF